MKYDKKVWVINIINRNIKLNTVNHLIIFPLRDQTILINRGKIISNKFFGGILKFLGGKLLSGLQYIVFIWKNIFIFNLTLNNNNLL